MEKSKNIDKDYYTIGETSHILNIDYDGVGSTIVSRIREHFGVEE